MATLNTASSNLSKCKPKVIPLCRNGPTRNKLAIKYTWILHNQLWKSPIRVETVNVRLSSSLLTANCNCELAIGKLMIRLPESALIWSVVALNSTNSDAADRSGIWLNELSYRTTLCKLGKFRNGLKKFWPAVESPAHRKRLMFGILAAVTSLVGG